MPSKKMCEAANAFFDPKFNSVDFKNFRTAMQVCVRLADWMDAHGGRKPSRINKDLVESRLGHRLSHFRQAIRTPGKKKVGRYHPKYLEYMTARGYPDVFKAQR